MIGPISGMRLPVWDWSRPGADKYIYVRLSDLFAMTEQPDGAVTLLPKLPFTVDADGNVTFAGDVYTGGDVVQEVPAAVDLREPTAAGEETVGIGAPPDVQQSYRLIFPPTDPGPNQVMVFDPPIEVVLDGKVYRLAQGRWVDK